MKISLIPLFHSCGHIGCGRRAHLPALGGGHSKHHYHTTHINQESISASSSDGKKKRVKILRILRSSSKGSCISNDAVGNADSQSNTAEESAGEVGPSGHEVCIDIVSKAVHCYECDDYVLSDASWLAKLRNEIDVIEQRREETSSTNSSTDDEERKEIMDYDYEMVDPLDDDANKEQQINDKKMPAAASAQAEVDSPANETISPYEPGITGLTNLGNTCYMNSVVQMLSHCSGFRSFFRDFLRAAAPLRLAGEGGYKISRQSTTRLKDTLHVDTSPDKLALTEATHALLRVLWSGRWPYVSPRYFVHAVWKHGGLFAARKQQDANEFLNFYLGRVDDELKAPKATSSVMMDLFGIDQYQEVQCDGCSTVTKRTEPLLGLVLSLPDEDKTDASVMADSDSVKVEKEIDLLECFKSLQTTGRFIEENQFHCDKCNCKRDATWSVALQRRPQSLLISLRRTLWNPEKGVHKDSRRVKFPVELDASQLLEMENDKTSPVDAFEGCHYSLISVVSHSGSSPFVGHYISWCRVDGVNGKKWYLFNDSSVTRASEANVLEAEAFILLYERRGLPSAG